MFAGWMTEYGEFTLGVWLVLFGVAKSAIGILALGFPAIRDVMAHSPVLSLMIEDDKTFAGVYTEVILILFGMYSFLHGASILGITRGRFASIFDHPSFFAVVNFAFAAALIAFYSIVLFTDVPIQKDRQYLGHYWIALATGVAFLAMPVGLVWWQSIVADNGAAILASTLAMFATLLVILVLVRIAFQYKKKKMDAVLLSLITVPLNAF
jgi:hypothetical protein